MTRTPARPRPGEAGFGPGEAGCAASLGFDPLRPLRAGLLAAALGGAIALACQPATAGFDGERAFTDLRELVALGPRPAGSPASARARELIAERLRQAGFEVAIQPFEALRPDGSRVAMANVVGAREGRLPDLVLFVTHYDTKAIEGVPFVGANDGASGVALLLELARSVPARSHEVGLRLLFCDGEEAFGRDITRSDGLYGSRALAARMAASGELARTRALVLVDMVADADLNLAENLQDSPRLRRHLRAAAEAQGVAQVLDPAALAGLVDDHVPFVERGVSEVLTLIDFQFGGRTTPGTRWHTARDDLGAVSAASLNTVGRLVIEVLERLHRDFSQGVDRSGR